ncbi:MAG: hypothetical protein F6K00_16785 [Leptolyngbya sp. SIOISBB]|nr:hypothetical protein [Leptolyngbya sp. SIOISBB]
MVNHLYWFKSWGLCGFLLVVGLAPAAQAQVPEASLETTNNWDAHPQENPVQATEFLKRPTARHESLARLEVDQALNSSSVSQSRHQPSPPKEIANSGNRSESQNGFQSAATVSLLSVKPANQANEMAATELKTNSDDQSRSAKPHTSKKAPKSVTPLLSRFLGTPGALTDQPTVASPLMNRLGAPTTKPVSPDDTAAEMPQDPELGVIQVAEVRRDDELGVIQLRNPLQDPELGIIELRQIAPPPRRSPVVYLSSFVTASSSDNIFLVEDPVQGRFSDNFIRPGISITAFPALGPDTNLLLVARTTFLRYQEQSNSSYDELRFQAGVRHRFSERVYGQFSLSQQLLYDEGFIDQFFTNTGVELTVGRRDRLTPQLTLDSYYQGQIFFSDPERFSNVLNSVGGYLGYQIAPQWDAGIGYRLTISDFTQQSRHETYQRLTGQLRYSITPGVRMSLFGGLSTGRSSESRITFDDTFFGISFDATVSIF